MQRSIKRMATWVSQHMTDWDSLNKCLTYFEIRIQMDQVLRVGVISMVNLITGWDPIRRYAMNEINNIIGTPSKLKWHRFADGPVDLVHHPPPVNINIIKS